MNEADLQKAYEEQNRRDFITNATIGTFVCIPLNLFCTVMDHYMYPDRANLFLKARLTSAALTGLGWLWFKFPFGRTHYRFGCMWYLSPLLMILWMIYETNSTSSPYTPYAPYYAGLNIILLGMGLLTPWAYLQNLAVSLFVLIMYVFISLSMTSAQAFSSVLNNATFLLLTAVLVVSGSVASSQQRFRGFRLRWELDLSQKLVSEKNLALDSQNQELADTIQKLTAAESQLVQSEKMASLGRMSAGIIHEINNPLNFATTSLFTLRKKAKHIATEQLAEYEDTLKDVEDGITRVKNIVSDLRMFTHPSTDDQDQVDASEVVASAMRFLSNELKEKVNVEQKLSEHQTVHANKNKLIHVFVNLIQNSLDALRIKPFNNGERPTIWIEGRVENGLSCLIVRDNGPGIANEHLDKIFDPFFTTKEVGEGMGLGLSICYRIMHESQGRISVRTEVGKFSEFTLEFPVKA